MKKIRERLGLDRGADAGLSLIEVIVAMTIFMIVATAMAYSLANILTLTRDARSRAVAANLAAEYIDNARSIENIFTINNLPNATAPVAPTRTIDGVVYTITRSTGWVTSTDSTAQCGAASSTAGGAYEYKRVAVYVTWAGMRAGTNPVRSDTLLAPNKRINDPALGTVAVSVLKANGLGTPGVKVSVVPSAQAGNTATPVPEPGADTDADGCSYVLKVTPGNYDVTITRTGYVDALQKVTTSSTNVTVAAGGSAVARFLFDDGVQISRTYPASTLVPTNLQTTFSTTYADTIIAGQAAVRLHPFAQGYQLIAGTVRSDGTCLSPDPAAWPVRAGDGAIGVRPDPIVVTPGSSISVPVDLGRVSISSGGPNGKFVTAVLQPTSAGGNPGCTSPKDATGTVVTQYTFPVSPASGAVIVGLPYGTYKLYLGDTLGAKSNDLSGVQLDSAGLPIGTAVNVITVDPRRVQ